MKTQPLFLLAALLCSASAHDTQLAGNVQVTMFTDAEDELRVGAATNLTFSFVHSGQPITTCHCRVLLYKGTPSARVPPLKDLYLDALTGGQGKALLDGLPAGGYTLVLDGRPTKFGDFDAFRMRYVLSTQSP